MMKKAFTLLELIFVIVVLGILASVAIPKLMTTTSSAKVSSLKQDIRTVTSSVQSYYITNGSMAKISDAVMLNSSLWTINDKKIEYFDGNTSCVNIEITTSGTTDSLVLTIDSTAGDTCKKLSDSGIISQTLDNVDWCTFC